MTEDTAYTFEPLDYMKFMPYRATSKGAGRQHICPICGKRVWSAWGHADKHWQKHGKDRDKMYGLFYPETGERVTLKQYSTTQEAVNAFLGKMDWFRIKPQAPGDLAAFMSETAGDIIVIRQVEAENAQ